MRVLLNGLFWLAFMAVIFCACFMLCSGCGIVAAKVLPSAAPFIRVFVLAASVLLTPVALAGIALLVRKE